MNGSEINRGWGVVESDAEKEYWAEQDRKVFAKKNMDYDKIIAKINQIKDDLSREGFTVREARYLLQKTDSAIDEASKRCLDNSKLASIEID